LVLPFTVATSFLFLYARPSPLILVSCSVVTFGFFIGVFLDGVPVSPVGVMFGVSSSIITALHAVVIKRSLEIVGGNAIHLSWFTNLLGSLALIPVVILAGEGPNIIGLFTGRGSASNGDLRTFFTGSLIAVCAPVVSPPFTNRTQGGLGFLMSIASLLSIKVTSPITHMVTSAVRGVLATLLGMWLFHDIITAYASLADPLLSTSY
jgi:solute carrier family 35 (GDP-fucose transporter), member C1